jgi:hypothetical protein
MIPVKPLDDALILRATADDDVKRESYFLIVLPDLAGAGIGDQYYSCRPLRDLSGHTIECAAPIKVAWEKSPPPVVTVHAYVRGSRQQRPNMLHRSENSSAYLRYTTPFLLPNLIHAYFL